MDRQFTLAEVTRLIQSRYADQLEAKTAMQWKDIQQEIDALRAVQKECLNGKIVSTEQQGNR